MSGNPEILRWRRALAPALALSIGGVAAWGLYIGKGQMDAVNAVVTQYMGTDGCLTDGPYDDRDGIRNNIKVKGIGVPGPTIIDVQPNRSDMNVLHLQFVGTPEGDVELGFAGVGTARDLLEAHCKVQDGM